MSEGPGDRFRQVLLRKEKHLRVAEFNEGLKRGEAPRLLVEEDEIRLPISERAPQALSVEKKRASPREHDREREHAQRTVAVSWLVVKGANEITFPCPGHNHHDLCAEPPEFLKDRAVYFDHPRVR